MDLVERFRRQNLAHDFSFSVEEYAERLRRVRDAMREKSIDLLILNNLATVCYLTGYETPMSDWYVCLFVPAHGDVVLHACDVGLALTHARLPNVEWVRWDTMGLGARQLLDTIQGYGVAKKRVGLEMRRPGLNVDAYITLKTNYPDADFIDATDVVSRIRVIKSHAEIACMKQAARYTDAGISAAIAAVRVGVTDNSIAAAAGAAMVDAGSEYFSIPPLVRAGPRTSLAHATNRRHVVKHSDPIILEMGGVHNRYTAPIYRTLAVGEASPRLKSLSAKCLEALDCLYENIKPGRTFHDAASAVAKILLSADPEAEVVPSCGYSVGLGFPPDWVEHSVFVRIGSEEVFEPGMVFHTPRSLRVPGVISAGFSEAILVTPNGCEPLSRLPRELTIV
jgi:Xaa-Pro dipeptidase